MLGVRSTGREGRGREGECLEWTSMITVSVEIEQCWLGDEMHPLCIGRRLRALVFGNSHRDTIESI